MERIQRRIQMLARDCQGTRGGIARGDVWLDKVADLKMANPFFEYAILNSPYEVPQRHWELDGQGQPTQRIIETRRRAGVAESHPKVRAYVKNHNLGLDVPYRYGSEMRTYRPDFIVLVDDGHGDSDLLHLVVEIKGYRREDAKEKKSTMETYWVPGVNNLKSYGRWAFAEFTDVYEIQADFKAKVESAFNRMISEATRS